MVRGGTMCRDFWGLDMWWAEWDGMGRGEGMLYHDGLSAGGLEQCSIGEDGILSIYVIGSSDRESCK